ncbi:carbamoyltransferase C-terminal domain-containing protein [Methylobacterium sp. AMS5]|uniref:carbamoyltransferase C-terminal domain-containing protein n=1 Tax=Methylobacterium sp. AMS5 TaxID=925818 RepID=UPI001187735B
MAKGYSDLNVRDKQENSPSILQSQALQTRALRRRLNLHEIPSWLFRQECQSSARTAKSPYVIFSKVRNKKFAAAPHVDGSSRIQTINYKQNTLIYEIIKPYKQATWHGIIYKYYLENHGRGFTIARQILLNMHYLSRWIDLI